MATSFWADVAPAKSFDRPRFLGPLAVYFFLWTSAFQLSATLRAEEPADSSQRLGTVFGPRSPWPGANVSGVGESLTGVATPSAMPAETLSPGMTPDLASDTSTSRSTRMDDLEATIAQSGNSIIANGAWQAEQAQRVLQSELVEDLVLQQ